MQSLAPVDDVDAFSHLVDRPSGEVVDLPGRCRILAYGGNGGASIFRAEVSHAVAHCAQSPDICALQFAAVDDKVVHSYVHGAPERA